MEDVPAAIDLDDARFAAGREALVADRAIGLSQRRRGVVIPGRVTTHAGIAFRASLGPIGVVTPLGITDRVRAVAARGQGDHPALDRIETDTTVR